MLSFTAATDDRRDGSHSQTLIRLQIIICTQSAHHWWHASHSFFAIPAPQPIVSEHLRYIILQV